MVSFLTNKPSSISYVHEIQNQFSLKNPSQKIETETNAQAKDPLLILIKENPKDESQKSSSFLSQKRKVIFKLVTKTNPQLKLPSGITQFGARTVLPVNLITPACDEETAELVNLSSSVEKRSRSDDIYSKQQSNADEPTSSMLGYCKNTIPTSEAPFIFHRTIISPSLIQRSSSHSIQEESSSPSDEENSCGSDSNEDHELIENFSKWRPAFISRSGMSCDIDFEFGRERHSTFADMNKSIIKKKWENDDIMLRQEGWKHTDNVFAKQKKQLNRRQMKEVKLYYSAFGEWIHKEWIADEEEKKAL
ncbi:uncharacterized protein MONOS_5564 [Monocercomonoides exilis]|uniref:uncharacterized protein n=1 Tax=Monocercomonoides exilis TaxID=2049356 RepID=UPI00355A5168|nr:hypothetical protein MONOS_5564 [Monocercomonoides exilis]|eukprot:MONOS_5564.1-p1 / transcript=MONOS_5564.1 / gene=MONOS_5564 / organism=Monocercomonoides_exilis_PA203 / gene_product=unspecified product / transcript_product=unspecified product / location=Mono_scaffold00163:76768-77685(+) / protein_length=306 / sequence_SO=supercontig / SO=protein_coding / is_pseudo=false